MRFEVTAALLSLGLSFSPVLAVDALVRQTSFTYQVEATGFTGRPMTVLFGNMGTPSTGMLGMASDGTTLWNTKRYLGVSSLITHTLGASSSQSITLTRTLADLAYSNNRLYGIVDQPGRLEVVTVGSDGVLTTVLNQVAATPTAGSWRFAGDARGDMLAAYFSPTSSTQPQNLYRIQPSTGTVVSSLPLSSPGSQNLPLASNLVLRNHSETLTTISMKGSRIEQADFSFPALSPQGVFVGQQSGGLLPLAQEYFSDEVDYPLSSVIADLQLQSSQGASQKLYRRPVLLDFRVDSVLANAVVPDGTTLTDVFIPGPVVTQIAGPMSIPLVQAPAAPGELSERSLGSASALINLGTIARGVYTFTINQTVVATHHTSSSSSVQPFTYLNQGSRVVSFGYDPVSLNLIGNGDLGLGSLGWETPKLPRVTGAQFGTFDSGHRVMSFTSLPLVSSAPSIPAATSQILELALHSGAMNLALTARVTAEPYVLSAYLNELLVASYVVTSTDYQTLNFLVDVPELYGDENVNLTLYGVSEVTTSLSRPGSLFIQQLSLTAIPEPRIACLLLVPYFLLRSRRLV